MGNCKSSCFKIGSDSTQVDRELSPPEGLRKKYARHQVPSNSVISEPQLIALDKGNPEATTVNFQSEKNSSVPEKTPLFEQANIPAHFSLNNSEKPQSVVKLDETETLPSAVVNSESPSVVEEKENTTAVYPEVTDVPNTAKSTSAIDTNLHENNAIVIQAAARRFLAQRELKKLKHVVKLQAAVRGHVVRRQAIGTLRCIHALVKMQLLVRAHLARQCQSLKNCNGLKMDNCKMSRDSNLKSNNTNSTIEKLLSNAFAHQLLESMPKAKYIHVTCDPMRHDSAWQWLERWMALTSSETADQKDLISQGYDHEENSVTTYEEVDVVPDSDSSLLSGTKFSPRISPTAEGEGNSEVHNSVKFESQTSAVVSDQCFSSLVKVDKEHSESECDPGIKEENSTKTEKGKETSNPAAEAVQYPNYADFVSGELNSTAKNDASDSVEVEDKKFDIGSKKVRNPAFAAVQAKFEELSLASKATRSTSYHSRDPAVESKPYKSHVEIKPYIAQVDSVTMSKGISSTENLIIQNPVIQAARSECGTEISISSTLDSPERSEADGGEEIAIEIGATREGNHNLNNGANDSFNFEDLKAEAEQPSNDPKEKAMQNIDDNMANSTSPVESVNAEEQPAETTALSTSNQGKNLKARASSEVTQQAKTSKTQNSVHSRKPKSKSISKSSPSKVKNDLGEKSSNEHLPKDVKNVNRRISFGVTKSDAVDQEPRRSTSNSLPSYMQATESARAKAHGSSSVKSSPDIHDKENHVKKRHSLPIGDEKQDLSPRVQKTSQTPKSSKGNNTPSPHSSAERRWQR